MAATEESGVGGDGRGQAIIQTIFGKFRISYTGGPTQTDVVLTAL
jgi:hypothetical protein